MSKKELSPAEVAANNALAAIYAAPAKVIASKSKTIETAKGATWGAFKDGARIALEKGQTPETMGKGLTLACAAHGVPQGTVNAYLPILKKLAADLIGTQDEAARAALLALSIADARKKYQPKKTAPAPAPAASTEAGNNEASGEAGDGTAGDDNGIMGGTERSRLLSAINAKLGELSDDDLRSFLAMLEEPATPRAEAA